MVLERLRRGVDYLFGQTNTQQLAKFDSELGRVDDLAEETAALSDDALRSAMTRLRDRLHNGESRRDVRPEVYALVREASERTIGLRPYDVQILGAIALDERRIAEMQTGEGKTLVATLPAVLNSLVGNVHIVTVNDYLARRDCEWMGPIYGFFGLSVGLLQDGMPP